MDLNSLKQLRLRLMLISFASYKRAGITWPVRFNFFSLKVKNNIHWKYIDRRPKRSPSFRAKRNSRDKVINHYHYIQLGIVERVKSRCGSTGQWHVFQGETKRILGRQRYTRWYWYDFPSIVTKEIVTTPSITTREIITSSISVFVHLSGLHYTARFWVWRQ